jgi:hypothetical protein
VILASGHGSSPSPAPQAPPASTTRSRPARRAAPERPAPNEQRVVALRGVTALDPAGDGQEHDDEAPAATDGDPGTFWATETYSAGLNKPGVGLVLDAGGRVALARLTLTTDTPGFTAQIKSAADSENGPYTAISRQRQTAAQTRFALHGAPARYYLVWITQLDQVAHVNEVRALRPGSTAR